MIWFNIITVHFQRGNMKLIFEWDEVKAKAN